MAVGNFGMWKKLKIVSKVGRWQSVKLVQLNKPLQPTTLKNSELKKSCQLLSII
jgi:hypothetical protein